MQLWFWTFCCDGNHLEEVDCFGRHSAAGLLFSVFFYLLFFFPRLCADRNEASLCNNASYMHLFDVEVGINIFHFLKIVPLPPISPSRFSSLKGRPALSDAQPGPLDQRSRQQAHSHFFFLRKGRVLLIKLERLHLEQHNASRKTTTPDCTVVQTHSELGQVMS